MQTLTARLRNGNGGHFLALLLLEMTLHGVATAMEMPAELRRVEEAAAAVNLLKTAEYARQRLLQQQQFPAEVNGVELPPTIAEDEEELVAQLEAEDEKRVNEENAENAAQVQNEENFKPPAWLLHSEVAAQQQQQQQRQQSHIKNNNKHFVKQPSLPQQQQQLHKSNSPHQSALHDSAIAPSRSSSVLRHCSIEVTNKIPGVCQPMPPMGSACVSGDYMDIINLECM